MFSNLQKIFLAFNVFFTSLSYADSPSTDTFIKTEMTQFIQKQGIPGAEVVLYHNGKISLYSFGVTNIKTKTPVNNNTIFELGSITKTFTALLLAEKINQGELKLTTPLSELLPSTWSLSSSISEISLLELATHTSSLPFNVQGIPYNTPSTAVMNTRLHHFLATWQAPYACGTKADYSNMAFGLLGIGLANQSHANLPSLIKKNILIPLQMRSTGFIPNNKYYAQGYDANGKPARSPQAGMLAGSWGMKASGNDMQHYLKAALMTEDTPANIRQAMLLTETPYVNVASKEFEVGLGWLVIPTTSKRIQELRYPSDQQTHHTKEPKPIQWLSHPTFDPHTLIDKTGSTDGFRSYIAVLPDKKTGMVILTNRFIAHYDAIPDEAIQILFHLQD